MDRFPDTRSSLLLRVKNKASDEHAWQEFAELYQPVIIRMAKSKGMQEADAQDLAQQVLVSVHQAILRWEPRSTETRFRNWLSKITRNAILKALTRSPQGLIESFELDGWWQAAPGETSGKTAYHLDVVRLSQTEVDEWITLESKSTSYRLAPVELSDREIESGTSDLNNQRRVVFWLRRLDQNIVQVYSDELFAALSKLSQHTHPLYRSLSERLLGKIKPEQRSPFQVIVP